MWNFDPECVHDQGAYREIAEQLCRIADRPDAPTGLREHLHLDAATAARLNDLLAGREPITP
ncbi:hypothetical protein [Streptomyces sp. NPDC058045]|uniref:hypothetical protein n=1 Tax=Streptomyces sp. NPDC058045 TaxID=3346311 RepID=UPI0036EEA541